MDNNETIIEMYKSLSFELPRLQRENISIYYKEVVWHIV